jgi:hypothetical protein
MRLILVATLVLVAGGTAQGADFDCLWWLRPWPINRSTCTRGPDDYCSKRLPTVCPTKCFGCDDYRPKCLPKIPCGCYPVGASCGPVPCR